MSFRVVGYTPTGQRITSDDGPSRARLTSGGIGGSAIAGGFPIGYTPAAKPRVSHHALVGPRPYRPGRPSLRGQASLDRRQP